MHALFKTPSQKLKNTWQRDKPASTHINVLGHVDPVTLIDKNASLIRLFRLEGFDVATQSAFEIDRLKNHLNRLWKQFSSEFAVTTWLVREEASDFLDGTFDAPFADSLNAAYRTQLKNQRLLRNTWVLAVMTKLPEGALHKTQSWFKRLNQKFVQAAQVQAQQKLLSKLNAATNQILSHFDVYQIRVLGTFERNGQTFSESLSFLARLLNPNAQPVPLVCMGADTLLIQSRLFFNAKNGLIEWRGFDGSSRVGAMITIKEYANFTRADLLEDLLQLKQPFVLTQSYRFYDRMQAKQVLKAQVDDFVQTEEDAISQTESLTDALDDTASGEVGLGCHHFTLLCLAKNREELNAQVSSIITHLSHLDILSVREDLLSECGFWAQLPGNFAYLPRPAVISTQNFAAFSSFHNTAIGQRLNNHWGEAVAVLETHTHSPYYFNFHHRDVGNTLIFGSMGSGKTALMGFLLAQSLKFGGKRIVFDKDRGLEILVRALKGHYSVIKPGVSTGFNPCQLPDTLENRTFLAVLFRKMLTTYRDDWDEAATAFVTKAIDGLYTLPVAQRQLCHLAPYFGLKTPGSLRVCWDVWHSGGEHAWVFDNATDNLNLDPSLLGFELGQLLSLDSVKIPLCLYLLHRIHLALQGERGGIFIDEGWQLLDDDVFKKEINDWGRTPRKKNRFLCLATQSANDAAKTAVCGALNESASNKLFFPNPSAQRETYIEALGLLEPEFHYIQTLDESRRFFLLNHGKGKDSVIVRAPLDGMRELAVLSGRDSSLHLLDSLRAQYGDDSAVWLPHFYAQLSSSSLDVPSPLADRHAQTA